MNKIFEFLLKKEIIAPLIIIIVTIFLSRCLSYIIQKLFTRGKNSFEKKRRTTIVELVNKILKTFLYVIAIMMILNIFGVDTNGLVASLGIAGVVLGLALQNTAQDLMSGISIIMDNYYVIGDYIKVNDFEGTVIDLSLKSTKVKAVTGEVYVFSNRNMDSVINYSQSNAGFIIDIPTAYEEETAKVEKVLKEVLKEAKKLDGILEDSDYLGINSFSASAINYAIILHCKSGMQWQMRRQVLKMIKKAYEQEGIKIPYDQIEVHNGKKI